MTTDFTAVHNAIRAWAAAGSGLPASSVYWGQQDSARVIEPAIEMKIESYNPIGQPWLDASVNYIALPTLTVTSVNATTDRFTVTAHGAANGDGPYHAVAGSGPLPAGLVALTPYWIIKVDANTLQLAGTFLHSGGVAAGGPPVGFPVVPVNVTTTGSTPFTLITTARSLRANQELFMIARGIQRMTVMFQCHTSDAIGMSTAAALLERINARQRLPSQQAILAAAHIGLTSTERVRTIHGTRNAVMFEPRAYMESVFSLFTEEAEYGQRIERTESLASNVAR